MNGYVRDAHSGMPFTTNDETSRLSRSLNYSHTSHTHTQKWKNVYIKSLTFSICVGKHVYGHKSFLTSFHVVYITSCWRAKELEVEVEKNSWILHLILYRHRHTIEMVDMLNRKANIKNKIHFCDCRVAVVWCDVISSLHIFHSEWMWFFPNLETSMRIEKCFIVSTAHA